jgi:hypothetical protein
LVTYSKTYWTYVLKLPSNLEQLLTLLGKTKYHEPEFYFNEATGQQEKIELNSDFVDITRKDSILRAIGRFEVVTHSRDLSGNHHVSYATPQIPFFIGTHPKEHLIINAEQSYASRLRHIISKVLFNDNKDHIFKVTMRNDQFEGFLKSVNHSTGIEYRDAEMGSIHKVAYFGTNTTKSEQRKGIDEHLREHIAQRISLHDETNWTLWINRASGKITNTKSHDPLEFVQFIQKKILTLSE